MKIEIEAMERIIKQLDKVNTFVKERLNEIDTRITVIEEQMDERIHKLETEL